MPEIHFRNSCENSSKKREIGRVSLRKLRGLLRNERRTCLQIDKEDIRIGKKTSYRELPPWAFSRRWPSILSKKVGHDYESKYQRV
jgi:hypothetical protein